MFLIKLSIFSDVHPNGENFMNVLRSLVYSDQKKKKEKKEKEKQFLKTNVVYLHGSKPNGGKYIRRENILVN